MESVSDSFTHTGRCASAWRQAVGSRPPVNAVRACGRACARAPLLGAFYNACTAPTSLPPSRRRNSRSSNQRPHLDLSVLGGQYRFVVRLNRSRWIGTRRLLPAAFIDERTRKSIVISGLNAPLRAPCSVQMPNVVFCHRPFDSSALYCTTHR